MTRFTLQKIYAEEKIGGTITCKGFLSAEKMAEKLLRCDDRCDSVAIYEGDESEYISWLDHYVMRIDKNLDMSYLQVAVMGQYGGIAYIRDLNPVDECEVRRWRAERERHIYDLTSEEYSDLLNQVRIGGIYVDDYKNDYVDVDEAYRWCDGFSEWLSEEHLDFSVESWHEYFNL